METEVNHSPIMERRNNYRCIYTASVVISWVRLVCMVALIIMYSVMMAMGWIPQYIEFVNNYTFKDFDKFVPHEFVRYSLFLICTRTILCVMILLGIHLKEPRYIANFMVNEVIIFISLAIFCVTYVSIYNLKMGNWVLGISQLLIGYTYIMYLFISLYILFRCCCEISKVKRMAENSANMQSEFIELATGN